MGKKSSDNKSVADAKGKARMRKYEDSQKTVEKKTVPDDIKVIIFWEKIGKDGMWEEKEYHQKIKER